MVTPLDKKPQRADKILKSLFPTLTSRHVDEALEASLVTKNGKKIKKGTYLLPLEIETSALSQHLENLKRGNRDLKLVVINETPEEWIIDKPAGMVSQPLSLFDRETPTHWAFAKDPGLLKEFGEVQPTLTPHRLDRGTSGLLIVCRNKLSFQKWRLAFEKKEVKKKYLAWCVGNVPSNELEMREPIGHHPSDPRKMVVVSGLENKYRMPLLEAHTQARLRQKKGPFSLWEVECSTGVTHQVRVHMASLGLPLVDDSLYNPQFVSSENGNDFHWLRAFELSFNEKHASLDTSEFEKGP